MVSTAGDPERVPRFRRPSSLGLWVCGWRFSFHCTADEGTLIAIALLLASMMAGTHK
jgi:hypothetical protein